MVQVEDALDRRCWMSAMRELCESLLDIPTYLAISESGLGGRHLEESGGLSDSLLTASRHVRPDQKCAAVNVSSEQIKGKGVNGQFQSRLTLQQGIEVQQQLAFDIRSLTIDRIGLASMTKDRLPAPIV